MKEPIAGKKVEDLPGIGPETAKRLHAKGFHNAAALREHNNYLKDDVKFYKFLNDACHANKKQAKACSDCLNDFDSLNGAFSKMQIKCYFVST